MNETAKRPQDPVTTRVYSYEKCEEEWKNSKQSQEWVDFLEAMKSGKPFECDESMTMYWLEVLPPVFMYRDITFLPGYEEHPMRVSFGFAEGTEPITVFWTSLDQKRYYGQRTRKINNE